MEGEKDNIGTTGPTIRKRDKGRGGRGTHKWAIEGEGGGGMGGGGGSEIKLIHLLKKPTYFFNP